MKDFFAERPTPAYSVGSYIKDVYQGVQGEVRAVEWSYTFGTWAYKILQPTGSEVWVYGGHYLRSL